MMQPPRLIEEKEEIGETDQIDGSLHCVTKHTELWKRIIHIAASVVEEGTLLFTASGMRIHSFFNSQCAFLNVDLKRNMFAEFDLTEDSLPLGQSFKKMNKVLHRLRNQDILSVSYLGEDNVCYEVCNGGDKNIKRIRHLKLLTVSGTVPLVNTTYGHELKVASHYFHEMIEDLSSNGGEKVKILMTNERTVWSVEDVDGSEIVPWRHHSEGEIVSEESTTSVQLIKGTEEELELCFALKPFLQASKAFPLSRHVKISFASDLPAPTVKIEYLLDEDLGRLVFVLAARSA